MGNAPIKRVDFSTTKETVEYAERLLKWGWYNRDTISEIEKYIEDAFDREYDGSWICVIATPIVRRHTNSSNYISLTWGSYSIQLYTSATYELKKQHEEERKRHEKDIKERDDKFKKMKEDIERERMRHEQQEQRLTKEVKKYKSADFETWAMLKNDDSMFSLLDEIKNKYFGTEMEKLRAYAKDEFGIDPSKFNLAITGQSGVGKSTLINALRELSDYANGAAGIGVTETTHNVKGYYHPVVKHLVLYDLPGAGTVSHPNTTYFRDKGLYAVDFMLVVMVKRTFEGDLVLAKLAQDRRIPIVFVRNQTENDFNTMRKNSKYNNMEDKELIKLMIADIKKSMEPDFSKYAIQNPHVFCIESHSLRERKNMKFEELDLLDHLSKLQHPHKNLSLKALKLH